MESPVAPESNGNKAFWPRALVVFLILIGVGLTAYFGTHLLQSARQLRHGHIQPGETNVDLIRGWMTIPYIAHAYQVPESTLWDGLGILEEGNRHKNLRTLDRDYAANQPGVILDKVKTIIQDFQAQHPITPTPH